MATPKFNFLAEYAKSSRSSCKNCGDSIDKGVLRLAEMVQVHARVHACFLVNCFMYAFLHAM